MRQLIGITVVFLIFNSVRIEGTGQVQLSNNDEHRVMNGLEATSMSFPLIPQTITKNLKKRSVIKLDFHEGPTMHRIGSGGPRFAKWSYWPDIESDKIISLIEQCRNHALVLQERKNPSFSPWGGKRDSSTYKSDPKIRRPARVPFNSWGGKRDGEHTDVIKKPFNSWGGKRSFIMENVLRLPVNDFWKKSWQYPAIDNANSESLNQHDVFMSRLNTVDKKAGFVNPASMSINNNLRRVPFDPWGGRKRNNYSNENDISVSSSPSYLPSE